MRFMAFLALILLIAPVSAVCEEEKAEYEKALADYNANPTEETNNALKAAYLRYTVCVSKNTVVEIEETVTATPTSNEIPPECREKYEEYMSAWNLYLEKGDPDYYFEARNKQYEYYSCLESHPASTAATPTTTSTPGPQEEVEKTPERIREPMRIHEKQTLVEISKPTDEVLDQKFVQLMEELERELENYSPSESDPEVMDRIVDAANRLVEREAEMEKIAASRDVETQNLVSEIVSSTPESEKSLVEELLYMALEKSKEKAVEATEAYLKEELKKKGYGKLVSKVEKFEEWNSKANDYLSKAVELKEFKE